MGRCEDWPCCGHEDGSCPDYDESGRQLNMRCTCGAILPLDFPTSICDACHRRLSIEDGDFPELDDFGFEDDFDEDDAQHLERSEDPEDLDTPLGQMYGDGFDNEW
jgi:hypothetical protein